MKRYIALRLSFASVFVAVVDNYNMARESRIAVERVSGNAVELISLDGDDDLKVIEKLMVDYEGTWADEIPPPTEYCNPMPDVLCYNSTLWRRKIRDYERSKVA